MHPTKDDLEKARDIIRQYRAAGGSILAVGGTLDERVSKLIAKGIALGREEAIKDPHSPCPACGKAMRMASTEPNATPV